MSEKILVIENLKNCPCHECITKSICISKLNVNTMSHVVIAELSGCSLFFNYVSYIDLEYYKIYNAYPASRMLIEFCFPFIREKRMKIKEERKNENKNRFCN